MSLNYCMQTYSCPQYWALPNFPTTDSVNCQTAVRLVWTSPKSKMFIPCAKDIMFRRIWKVSIYFWGNNWTELLRLSQKISMHINLFLSDSFTPFVFRTWNEHFCFLLLWMYIPSASFAILSMSAGYLSMPWLTLFHCG